MTAVLWIISVCKSVMSAQEQEECVCVCVHQEAFGPQQMLKPWEVGRRGAVCVRVETACRGSWTCVGSHGTLRTVGWSSLEVGARTSSTQTHSHQIPFILNIEGSTEGALDFNTASPMKDTLEVKLTCESDPRWWSFICVSILQARWDICVFAKT